MKKLISAVLCVALLLSSAVLSGCSLFHRKHDFGKWDTTTEPTCTEAGEKVRSCKECDYEETEEIEAYGHTESILPAIEPTCTAEGKKEGLRCSDCNEILVEQKPIPMIEHSYEESISKEASCNQAGEKLFTCSACSDSYTEEFEMISYGATDVHNMVKDSVAEITTYDKKGNGVALGSGFVYQGNIVTNYHVIDGAYSAKVYVNGKTYDAVTVISYDKDIDLAILKLNLGGDELVSLSTCTANHQVGAPVYAVGSSKGQTDTFSQGIITNSKREMEGVTYVQHDAAISGGNSGGPLINQYCEVIGINTFTFKESQNLNFAIAVSQISKLQTKNYTFAEFYETECDAITRVGNYAVSNGTYETDYDEYYLLLDTSYSDEYTYTREVYYSETEKSLEFWHSMSGGCYLILEINSLNGDYEWTYFDENYNIISGYVNPALHTSVSNLVPSDTNIDDADYYNTSLQIATLMMRMLCNGFTADLYDAGVTASDLGFIHFN